MGNSLLDAGAFLASCTCSHRRLSVEVFGGAELEKTWEEKASCDGSRRGEDPGDACLLLSTGQAEFGLSVD